ncbi:MAG: hypothetical protein JST84_32445 [Acidobacteria bacterium]|nr:hypothetical protein [Acidobacteriota bacterium]
MFSHKRSSLISLFALFLCTLSTSALAQGTTPVTMGAGQGIPDVDVGLKKKPPGLIVLNYNLSNEGKLNLGQIAAGRYALVFTKKAPPCTTCRATPVPRFTVVIEGVKGGTISMVIDLERNVMFNPLSFTVQPLAEIDFEATGEDVITGTVAGIAITDSGMK